MKITTSKNIVLLFFCLLLAQWAVAQNAERYPIIPLPAKMELLPGEFKITPATNIVFEANNKTPGKAAAFLQDYLHQAYQLNISKAKKMRRGKPSIIFKMNNAISGDEGYTLHVNNNEVTVGYKTPKGAFWAVQTLRQLMQKKDGMSYISVPAVTIEDHPRFAHRGVMLDVARHYFPVDFIKKYIDLLAYYKINTFQIHLNDDQGWRLEIKKYPKLQEVAAWRKETRVGHRTDKPVVYDGKRHGGFYTQQELKDIVAYADARFITVVPEIDVPGHAQALLAAYPHLGCKDTVYEVGTDWGVYKEILCPKEETFKFLEDVFKEVISIFPGKYIHIGGDEVPKDRWKESAFCQQLIKKLNLKDENELQSYFIKRVETFLNGKGRAIIGWDEILEGGLAPNATVMSWRGEKGGIAAAKLGHNVIMSPNTFLYLDYYQTADQRKREPLANSRVLPLDKVYSYDPVGSLTKEDAKYILGPQANLWTEYISTPQQAELMTFPRVCAMAEVGWAALERKDYNDFLNRLNTNIKFLEKEKVNFARYNLALLPRSAPDKNLEEAVSDFLKAAKSEKQDIHSMMIIKDGKVVIEKWYGDNTPATPHIMNSVSKTFTAMGIGFAVEEGRLRTTDKVLAILPEIAKQNANNGFEEVTIEHLLTMTSGICVDSTEALRSKKGVDWVKGFAAAPRQYPVGTTHAYSSMSTYMLSAIIQKVTGYKLLDYLAIKLFRPLGITGATWQESPQSINTGGWGLYIKTEDMAKFGLFLLQKGRWNGVQLLSAKWIEKASSKLVETNFNKEERPDWAAGYGYQLWQCSKYQAYRADGANGQFIIVVPRLNAVIVATSHVQDMQKELNLIWSIILPAIEK